MLRKTKYILQEHLIDELTVALNSLKGKGYQLKFSREAECLYCFDWSQWITPANFKVDEFYFFVESANPDIDRILYAITLSQGGKGYLIDTSNVYADNISTEMVQKLNS